MVFFLAWRNLVRSRTRTLLLWVGISVSGALLYDMVMLSGGLEASFGTMLKQMNLDIRLTPRGALPFTADAEIRQGTPLVEEIRRDPRVAKAQGYYGTTLYWRVKPGDVPRPAFVIGVDGPAPEMFRLSSGSARTPTSPPSIWLNRHLAAESGARVGDTLEITGPPSDAVMRGETRVRLPVGAIGEFRFDSATQNSFLAPLEVARRLRGSGDQDPLSLIALRLVRPSESPSVAADLRRRFPQCEVYETRDLLARVRGQLTYFTQFSAILGSMSFIVAWLLISTLLVLSLNDRVGEFAVLRAIGIRPGRLVQVMLVESLVFVLVSVPSGLLLGLVTAGRLDALLLRGPGLPADLHFFVATGAATLRTVALLFLAGALGALYPMIRVARLPISSTLHEAVT